MILHATHGHRGWLEVTVTPSSDTNLARAKDLIEAALGNRFNWIAYDGESPVITIELSQGGPQTLEWLVREAITIIEGIAP